MRKDRIELLFDSDELPNTSAVFLQGKQQGIFIQVYTAMFHMHVVGFILGNLTTCHEVSVEILFIILLYE
jgi:hypothetical protein